MDVNKFLRKSLLCQLLASESLKALEERVGMRRQSLGTQQTKKRKKDTGKPCSVCEDCDKDGILLFFF